MKFVDAYILARTKRKTRRIRTALVVIISSLLFAVLFFAAFAVQGIVNTAQQVKDVGFNGRNLVMASHLRSSFDYEAANKKIEADMTAELKAQGKKVTEQTKLDPSWQMESSRRFNLFLLEQYAKEARELEATVNRLGSPSALYHFQQMDISNQVAFQADPNIDPVVQDLQQQEASGVATSKGGFSGSGSELQFYNSEQDFLRTQLQPGQNFDWQPGQPYPIVISYAYLEKLADQSFTNVPAAEKNKTYRNLLNEFGGRELTFCYRNSTAQDQLRNVVHYNYVADHDTDKTTKSIDVPVCGGFDQNLLKKLDLVTPPDTSTKPLFPQPSAPAPATRQIVFKIAGFVPSQPDFGSSDVISQILTTSSSLPAPPQIAILPREIVAQEALFSPSAESPPFTTIFADFATRDEQKAFIAKGCTGIECGNVNNDKPFVLPFGSVSMSLEGIISYVAKFVFIGLGVIMSIAAVMIMFTISKVISDSTREIAVFRSLGARRRDIAHIYYTYGGMLAATSLLLAVVLAVIGAIIATSMFKDSIANGFINAVGAYNTDVQATLFGLNWTWLSGIVGSLLLAALVGISVPIVISLRRKLIAILREE